MEVETRLPPSPGGPLSSAPRYSPITPETGTPAPAFNSTSDLPDPIHVDASDVQPSADPSAGLSALAEQSSRTDQEISPQLGHHSLNAANMNFDGSNSHDNAPGDYDPATDPFRRATEAIGRLDPISDPFEEIDEDENPNYTGHLPTAMDAASFADNAFTDAADSNHDSEQQIRAFARLEFGDGVFYMNTYQVIIGRDLQAAQRDERRKIREHDRRSSHSSQRNASNPDVEIMRGRVHAQRAAERSAAASVISGGIMMDLGDHSSRRRRKRNKSAPSSVSGRSRPEPRATDRSFNYHEASAAYDPAQPARPVDLTNMMPKPDGCPMIPIHPPQHEDGTAPNHKGISRQHVKIAYNTEQGLFEIEVIGRNGCFVDETHLEAGEKHPLASGTVIQIQSVRFKFVLPNVPDGETGTELRSDAVSQSGISLDFEEGVADSRDDDASEPTTDNEDDRYRELRLAQQAEAALSDDDDDDDEDDEEIEEMPVRKPQKGPQKSSKSKKASEKEPEQPRPKIKLKMSFKKDTKPAEEPEEPEVAPVKRKGPGRPPKNGIMSKREEAELRRKEKEAQKARKAEALEAQKEEAEEAEETSSPTEKRKAQKKKKDELGVIKAEEDAPGLQKPSKEILQSIELPDVGSSSAQAQPAPATKPPKEKRPPKPPRSPSPVWDEATLTPEQLAKPTHSYVILIHEALSNHPKQQMSLPQIYRAIERKYPYYKLKVQTVGWQSSVRHNLSQHQAFQRIERDGKGWMWGLDKSVSIEREKKRRPSPPPMQQHMYGVGPNGFNQPYQQNGFMRPTHNGQMPPPNPYVWNANAQGGRGYGIPNPGPGARPPYPPGPPGPNGPATYQSPYDSSRNNSQQTPTDPGRPNIPQQTSQMPPSYLNQHRSGQQGPVPPGSTAPAQATPAQSHPSLPAATQGQPSRPAGAPTSTGPQGQQNPGQTSASPPLPNNVHGVPPHVWSYAQRFRASLRKSLQIPDADAILDQAINKCLGIRPASGTSFRVFPSEKPILAACSLGLTKMGWPVAEKIAYAEGQQPAGATSSEAPQSRTTPGPSTGVSNATVPALGTSGQLQQARPPSTVASLPVASGPPQAQAQGQPQGSGQAQPSQAQTAAHSHPPGQASGSTPAHGQMQAPGQIQGEKQASIPNQIQTQHAHPSPIISQTAKSTAPPEQPPAQANPAQQQPISVPADVQATNVAGTNGHAPAPTAYASRLASPQEQGIKRPRSVEENTSTEADADVEPAAKREKLEQ